MRRVQLLLVVQDKNQTKAKHIHNVSGERQQEEEEVAVIPPTNAVVHPGTMVVKILRGHAVEKQKQSGHVSGTARMTFAPQTITKTEEVKATPLSNENFFYVKSIKGRKLPPRSCRRPSSESSVVAYRSGRLSTTSCAPVFL